MKTSRKVQSVYRNQNVLIRAIFERARDPRKVLCVALDYAKRKHVALICDGHGDVLKSAFPIENSTEGIAFLIEQISATARRRKIPKNQIFLGGEDEPAYVANFTAALRDKGYLVVRVNAYEAKENRENLLASTDTLDLLGIAKTLLSRRARSSGDDSPQNPVYHHLRELTRTRRILVRQETATANRIHAISDQLFPGFLTDSKSGLTAFSDASCALMKERFSAPEIARRKPAALALATTPYAMMTSIPGIGFVLATGVAGELGDPAKLGSTDSLCGYAGIVSTTDQTGGPDSPPVQRHASPRCNRILKDWTVQSAQKIREYGPPELKDRIIRWENNGQHATFAAARRYLRLLHALVKNQIPYLAPQGRGRHATTDDLAAAAFQTWTVLQRKWRTVPGGLDLITDEAHPIGFWRRVLKETHGIHLPERP